MKKHQDKNFRILAIAPSSRGFGFALLEDRKLVDSGTKVIAGDKNAGSVAKVEALMVHYIPTVIVLEDTSAKCSQRAPRIRELSKQLQDLAERRVVPVTLFSREKVLKTFFPEGDGTKHGVAEALASKYPSDLAFKLPPKRRPWVSEDFRMDIFDSVALAEVARLKGIR